MDHQREGLARLSSLLGKPAEGTLPAAELYLVITNPVAGYVACAEAAVRAGVPIIQLRMKHSPRAEIVRQGHLLREITAGTRTAFIVNDDPSVAAEVGADGVHLGQTDLSVHEARAAYPMLRIFGKSTHSLKQSVASLLDGHPDYIGVGPVYTTPTKDIPDPTLGPALAGEMVRSVPMPAVAIGGIDGTRLPDVLRQGIVNFSVVRAVCSSTDPYGAICRLQEIAESFALA